MRVFLRIEDQYSRIKEEREIKNDMEEVGGGEVYESFPEDRGSVFKDKIRKRDQKRHGGGRWRRGV